MHTGDGAHLITERAAAAVTSIGMQTNADLHCLTCIGSSINSNVHIQVVVRVRPMNDRELFTSDATVVQVDEQDPQQMQVGCSGSDIEDFQNLEHSYAAQPSVTAILHSHLTPQAFVKQN